MSRIVICGASLEGCIGGSEEVLFSLLVQSEEDLLRYSCKGQSEAEWIFDTDVFSFGTGTERVGSSDSIRCRRTSTKGGRWAIAYRKGLPIQ